MALILIGQVVEASQCLKLLPFPLRGVLATTSEPISMNLTLQNVCVRTARLATRTTHLKAPGRFRCFPLRGLDKYSTI